MRCYALNPSPASPLIPVIVMPSAEGPGNTLVERLLPLAEANLTFGALVVELEVSDLQDVEAWPEAFARAARNHRLTERGMVLGQGTGARLAQYFTLDNPTRVMACAALSADAWAEATEQAGDPTQQKNVQWLVGCGVREAAGLVRGAEQFQVGLAELGCAVDFLDWDDDPAELPDHALQNAVLFFNDSVQQYRAAA